MRKFKFVFFESSVCILGDKACIQFKNFWYQKFRELVKRKLCKFVSRLFRANINFQFIWSKKYKKSCKLLQEMELIFF